jgi:endonuclease YncB( thermonuclease family)
MGSCASSGQPTIVVTPPAVSNEGKNSISNRFAKQHKLAGASVESNVSSRSSGKAVSPRPKSRRAQRPERAEDKTSKTVSRSGWADDGLPVEENKSLIEKLRTKDFTDVPIHSFAGKVIPGKIDSIYDGDTMAVGFFYGPEQQENKYQIRLHGCDAPELRPRKFASLELKELEIEAAKIVRDRMIEMIVTYVAGSISPVTSGAEGTYGLVWIEFSRGKKDMYGRQLATIKLFDRDGDTTVTGKKTGEEINLTEWLISKRYAKPYFGAAKTPWTKAELTYIINSK